MESNEQPNQQPKENIQLNPNVVKAAIVTAKAIIPEVLQVDPGIGPALARKMDAYAIKAHEYEDLVSNSLVAALEAYVEDRPIPKLNESALYEAGKWIALHEGATIDALNYKRTRISASFVEIGALAAMLGIPVLTGELRDAAAGLIAYGGARALNTLNNRFGRNKI